MQTGNKPDFFVRESLEEGLQLMAQAAEKLKTVDLSAPEMPTNASKSYGTTSNTLVGKTHASGGLSAQINANA